MGWNLFGGGTQEDEEIAHRMVIRASEAAHSNHRRRKAVMEAAISEMDEKLVDELRRQNANLRARTERLQTSLRSALISNEGLLDTVRHLKAHWNPDDAAEASYKDKIDPLIDKMIKQAAADENLVADIDQRISGLVQP